MQEQTLHKDCFAYCDNGCNALKQLFCKFEKCKFYKTNREGKYPSKKTAKNNGIMPIV